MLRIFDVLILNRYNGFLNLLDCAYTLEDSNFGVQPKFLILLFEVKKNFFILLKCEFGVLLLVSNGGHFLNYL